jgi:outer membrane receptor protein involved in Fe transport
VDNQFCKLIRRNDDTTANPGSAGQVQGLYFNIGNRDIAGVDIDVNWSKDLSELGFDRIPGEIGIRTALNYLIQWKSQQVPGSPVVDYAGTGAESGLYDYLPFTTFSYRNDRLSVGLNWRHLPAIMHGSIPDNPTSTQQGSGSYNYFSLNGGWRFNETMRLRAGIDNLFDVEPEVYGATEENYARSSTITGRYDPLGRRGFVALEVNF